MNTQATLATLKKAHALQWERYSLQKVADQIKLSLVDMQQRGQSRNIPALQKVELELAVEIALLGAEVKKLMAGVQHAL